jgi:type VI secretion system protein ImpH
MADDARAPRPDLTLPAPAEAMGFFELLARLEDGGLRFGRAGRPADEPARLGQSPRMAFATRDVATLTLTRDEGPLRAEVAALGLLGPEGPMPLHLTRWVMARLSQRWFGAGADHATADTAFLDFCTLLQHRMIALYWRAWADAQPTVRSGQGDGGRLAATLAALSGAGLPGAETGAEAGALTPLRRAFATTLAREVNAPERLTGLLARLVGAPVELIEFVGEWVKLPTPLQTRLGRAHARLGRDAVLGPRSFQRQLRAELRVGPVGIGRFLELTDASDLRARVKHAILAVAGRELEFDMRLVLAASEVPPPRLGGCSLGRTTWIGRAAATDRDDLRLTRVTGTDGLERTA